MSMWSYDGHYSGPGERGVIPVGGDRFFSPRVVGYQGYRDNSWARARTSPTQPLASITPPKLPTTPIPFDSETTTAAPITISTDTHLLPPLYQPCPISVMEPPLGVRDLLPERILKFQTEHEGNLNIGQVSPSDLESWKSENPEVIEDDEIRYEYNFLTESLIIKCMPTPTHDSLLYFFQENLLVTLADKLGRSQARALFTIGSGTCM